MKRGEIPTHQKHQRKPSWDGMFQFRIGHRERGRIVSACSELFAEGASFLFQDSAHGSSTMERGRGADGIPSKDFLVIRGR
jgi:hypothetical protein